MLRGDVFKPQNRLMVVCEIACVIMYSHVYVAESDSPEREAPLRQRLRSEKRCGQTTKQAHGGKYVHELVKFSACVTCS